MTGNDVTSGYEDILDFVKPYMFSYFQKLILLFVVHGGMESHYQHYIGGVHSARDIRFWCTSVLVEPLFSVDSSLKKLSLMTSIACLKNNNNRLWGIRKVQFLVV